MSAPLERRLAWLITIGAGAAFVVLAALLVPWQPVPGGMPAPVSASDVFTAAEIARGEEFARTTRLLSWAALAVSVAVACVLGLTPRGTRLLGRRRRRS